MFKGNISGVKIDEDTVDNQVTADQSTEIGRVVNFLIRVFAEVNKDNLMIHSKGGAVTLVYDGHIEFVSFGSNGHPRWSTKGGHVETYVLSVFLPIIEAKFGFTATIPL